MQTVFLDFDGVLFDTLKEAYVLCRHVCLGEDLFAPIEEDKYAMFYRYKFLVFNSWQYMYLMKIISENNVLSDKMFIEKYNYYMNNRNIPEEDIFEAKYLTTRRMLIEKYPDYVDSLEQPFPFLDMVSSLDKNKFDIIIISRKNTFAIKRKGITFKIVGKEELGSVVNKSEFIEKYLYDNKIEKAYFVDDNSNNLAPCINIPNLKCLLAGWGNIAIDEIGLSQQEVFDCISQSL